MGEGCVLEVLNLRSGRSDQGYDAESSSMLLRSFACPELRISLILQSLSLSFSLSLLLESFSHKTPEILP